MHWTRGGTTRNRDGGLFHTLNQSAANSEDDETSKDTLVDAVFTDHGSLLMCPKTWHKTRTTHCVKSFQRVTTSAVGLVSAPMLSVGLTTSAE